MVKQERRQQGQGADDMSGGDQTEEQPTVAGPGEVRVRPYKQDRCGKIVPIRGHSRHQAASQHEGEHRYAADEGATVNHEAESKSLRGSRQYRENYEQGRKDADQWLNDEKNFREAERLGNPDYLKSHPGYLKGFMDAQENMAETIPHFKEGAIDGLNGEKPKNKSDFGYLRGWEAGSKARRAIAEGQSLPPQVQEAYSRHRDAQTQSESHSVLDSLWSFFGGSGLGDVMFPSKEELAKRLNIKTEEIHGAKKEITKVFPEECRRLKTTTPDLGYDSAGNLALRNPATGQAIKTKVPFDNFRR